MLQNALLWLTLSTLVSVWVVGGIIVRRLDLLVADLTERDVHAQMEVDGKNELTDMDLAILDPADILRHERRVKLDRIRYGYMPPIDDRGWPCWMAWKDWEETHAQGRRDLLGLGLASDSVGRDGTL
jgi:hypothetical protein